MAKDVHFCNLIVLKNGIPKENILHFHDDYGGLVEYINSLFLKKLKDLDGSFPEYDQDFIDHILNDGVMETKDGTSIIISWPTASRVTTHEDIIAN
jgi:hypothetical protein